MTKNFRFILILLFGFMLVGQFVLAEEVNYCKDPESWKAWDALLEKYPDDIEIHTLHALRLGLCVKIERGDLTVEEATAIFEKAKDIIIKNRKAQEKMSKKPKI